MDELEKTTSDGFDEKVGLWEVLIKVLRDLLHMVQLKASHYVQNRYNLKKIFLEHKLF